MSTTATPSSAAIKRLERAAKIAAEKRDRYRSSSAAEIERLELAGEFVALRKFREEVFAKTASLEGRAAALDSQHRTAVLARDRARVRKTRVAPAVRPQVDLSKPHGPIDLRPKGNFTGIVNIPAR